MDRIKIDYIERHRSFRFWEDELYHCDKGEQMDLWRRLDECLEEFSPDRKAIKNEKDRNSLFLDVDLDEEKDSDKYRKAVVVTKKKRTGKQLCEGVMHHIDYKPVEGLRKYITRDNYRLFNISEDELKNVLKAYNIDFDPFVGNDLKRK